MDLRSLRYFIAVAEEGNFGRAAARLRLSQPPLTRQIHALEEELGVALLVRNARGAFPTEAGAALLRDAREIVGLADRARERVRRVGRGEIGRLDIGIYGTVVIDYVPRLLAALAVDAPDLHVVLHNAAKAEQIEAVRQGHVLAAFDRNIPEEPDLEVTVAWREPMVVAMPATHRFAGHAGIDTELLAEEAFIIGSGRIDPTRRICRTAGFEPRIALEVADVMTALPLVACGIGMALAPISVSVVAVPGVIYRPLRDPAATFDLLCFHRAGDKSPLLAALRRAIAAIENHRTTLGTAQSAAHGAAIDGSREGAGVSLDGDPNASRSILDRSATGS